MRSLSHLVWVGLAIFSHTITSAQPLGGPGGGPFLPQAPRAKAVYSAKIPITVTVSGQTDLSGLLQNPREFQTAGVRFVRGWASSHQLPKIASRPGVTGVFRSDPRPAPVPPDPDLAPTPRKPVSPEKFLDALKKGPSFEEAQRSKPLQPAPKGARKSWYGNDLLGVQQAWDLGYDGTGIKIAIMDTGVDFANPDLMGTQARVDNPSSPHHGWPICFDGNSMAKVFVEETLESDWIAFCQFPGATVYSETATSTFEGREYVFFAESASGNGYRLGSHPDKSLAEVLGGNAPAFLVIDHPDVANRGPDFNTVYVDLDNDLDFRDEKPCFRGDEISYRDIFDSASQGPGADGYPDISGGMVYFIANGQRPFPAADWLYDAGVPIRGTMVAFMLGDYLSEGGNHGTTCASAAVAQGLIDGDAPPIKPPFQGPGDGMVQGPAKGAKIVAIGNYFEGGFYTDFQLFAALGYDGEPNTGDEPNIVSMSFGDGSVDNDGWDFSSRFVDSLNLRMAPQTTWFSSTGNGGPGYGTLNSPSPLRGVRVGACTTYDTCDEFDSIASAGQILSGEIQSFSNSGPSATGDLGTSVVAHGAWGSGDIPLNQSKDGWTAWDQWGGTSRSCPEAAGVTALIYQAYKNAHGDWPTSEEARRILMNTATDLKYDVHRQGAGRVHAGRAVAAAGGHAGTEVSPAFWTPGDYRGEKYSLYTHLTFRGETYVQGFEIANRGTAPQSFNLTDVALQEFATTEFAIDTVASPSEENSIRQPDYLHLFQGPGADSIPVETDLMILEAIYPFEVFDTDFVPGNPGSISPPRENVYRLLVYNWTDVDGDGNLYDDSIGAVPGLVEAAEIDAGEYMRFNYGYLGGTSQKVSVADPLEKMADGIWVGLRHREGPPEGTATQVKIRARFFREIDCSWLQTTPSTIEVPAGQTRPVTATVTVPPDQAFGFHTAKILFHPGGSKGAPGEAVVIPVSLNVAADFSGTSFSTAGGMEPGEPYSNRAVGGDFAWADRSEQGDGRFFFFDANNPQPGSYAVVKTTWEDDPPTDLDTLIFSPFRDAFSTPGNESYDPSFGPNALFWTGGSRSPGRPNWRFSTQSGGPLDIGSAPLSEGLHALFLHNILFAGRKFSVPFQVEVGKLTVEPAPLFVQTPDESAQSSLTIASGLPMDGLQFEIYGPSKVSSWYRNHEISQGRSWWWDFSATDCGLIEVSLTSTAEDVDLYLYRDGADGSSPDGSYTNSEIVSFSEGLDSNERLFLFAPPDGSYRALAYGFTVTRPDAVFSMTGHVVEGKNIGANPPLPTTLQKDVPVSTTLEMTLPEYGEYDAAILFGPSGAPQAVRIHVPIARVIAGDADYSQAVDRLDALEFARHWGSDGEVPSGIDFNHDGEVAADDLLRMIATLQP